jgi:hypothetical protein
MAEPLFQFLDAVNADDNREYIEFRFRDCLGAQTVMEVEFSYAESPAAEKGALPAGLRTMLDEVTHGGRLIRNARTFSGCPYTVGAL